MFYMLLLLGYSLYSHANERVVVHSDGIERIYSADDVILLNDTQKITLQYNFSSIIKNKQNNNLTAPQALQTPAPKTSSSFDSFFACSTDYIRNPLILAACACGVYILYYLKSKLSLYHLGKACVEKALWSLWKKKSIDEADEPETDAILLAHILQTYDTDKYTTAIARFLFDVEAEEDLLTDYINEAKNIQEGILRFFFEDLSEHIKIAQERLDALKELKKMAKSWLPTSRNPDSLTDSEQRAY